MELSSRAGKADFPFKIKTKVEKDTYVSGFQAASVSSIIEKGLHMQRAGKVYQFPKCDVKKELNNLLQLS